MDCDLADDLVSVEPAECSAQAADWFGGCGVGGYDDAGGGAADSAE